jgi:[acyl-carrier-protein] S-malonyltransferase
MFEGPLDELTGTENQQPALFVAGLANWRALQNREEIVPTFMAGHSLGELTALTAVGSLAFADGLRLVRRRGELMKEAGDLNPGAMAALLALDAEQVREVCRTAENETDQIVRLANDNCPGQIVISGHEQALQRAMELAEEAGARRVVRLPISIAAHSPLMASAAEAFATAVAETPVLPPQISVIGNVDARPLTDVDAIRGELQAQLTSPVAWTDSMRYMIAQGSDLFIEVGPGEVLLGLLKRIDRSLQRIAFDKGPAAG